MVVREDSRADVHMYARIVAFHSTVRALNFNLGLGNAIGSAARKRVSRRGAACLLSSCLPSSPRSLRPPEETIIGPVAWDRDLMREPERYYLKADP